jgi:hypothetical protein
MAARGEAGGDAQCHKLCAGLGLKTASFADLEFYRNGLEGLIGIPPRPHDVMKAMEAEHRGEDGDDPFSPPIFKDQTTTLSDEWGECVWSTVCYRARYACTYLQ